MKKSVNHKPYLLKIQSLERGWHDKDEVLLHAAFQLLIDFIESEKPNKIIDYNSDAEHRRAWKELQSLYQWWKKERPKRKNPFFDKRLKMPPRKFQKMENGFLKWIQPDKKKYRAYYRALAESMKLESKGQEEDQRNLHRLIDIRFYLWS